ncbi:MAG: dual specificity protein phosphatase family protein [Gemmatimonadaceae bacterium]|nr:dual specificity protein phosphatase family protein [Gloeobacterales cyanobacterium ES-bin-141]
MEELISQNLWWVVPGQLAGVRKPTAEEIPELRSSGVDAIVSVMDDPGNLDLYQSVGLTHLWLPVKGGTAPTREQIAELTAFIREQNARGAGVALHCTSGRRRTGTFLAAYLIDSGRTYEEALQIVLAANPEVELREAQLEFLREFAQPC